jgi:hypothetical protein
MDISRLPVTLPLQQSPASIRTSKQPASVEVVEPVEKISPRRQQTHESFTRAVQGELLQKERTPYQSTRGFINERNMAQARPAAGQRDTGVQSRAAIFQYLNNTRPEAVSDLTQGKSINFFV